MNKKKKAKILIPNFPGNQVISTCRSLGRFGDEIHLAWKLFLYDRLLKSRFIKKVHNITPSNQNIPEFIKDVIRLCKEYQYDILMPFGNESYYAVVLHSQELSQYVNFMAPSLESFRIAHDKLKTARFCQKIGIDTPVIYSDYDDQDLNSIANNVRYPVVIKARSGSGVEKGLRYANSRKELFSKYEEIISFESPTNAVNYRSPLIQEYIPGVLHDACALSINGSVVTVLTQIRQLMNPIYGGPGAINITTHNPELEKIARKLLEELNWHGPAQIEFKFDPRDNKYKIIEINPKLWGTIDLSIKVGVNFPLLIRNYLMEEKVERDIDYPSNVRYRFLFPQTVFAGIQTIREFGLGALKDNNEYSGDYTDLDVGDIKPDILRIVGTILYSFIGGINYRSSNLPREHIIRINEYKEA